MEDNKQILQNFQETNNIESYNKAMFSIIDKNYSRQHIIKEKFREKLKLIQSDKEKANVKAKANPKAKAVTKTKADAKAKTEAEAKIRGNYTLVVMPTYNRSQNIEQRIHMMLNQTDKKIDFLIIDDGSTLQHKTTFRQLREQYKRHTNIIFMENYVNMHIAKTLNKGIDYLLNDSKYSFFTWISDDNDYYPEFIETLKQSCSFFSYSAFDRKNVINGKVTKTTKQYDGLKDLLNGFHGCASFMWTRKAVQEIGLYTDNIRGCEDYEYLLRTFKLNEKLCKYVTQCLMSYKVHSDSLFQKDKSNILTLKSFIVQLYKYFIHNTTFIYYSKTRWDLLFQRPHQIMRFMPLTLNKCFIGNVNTISYDDTYKLLIVPYSLKEVVYAITNYKNIITYFTDTRLYNEIINKPGKKIYDLIDAPIGEFEVWKPNLEKCVENSDHVTYSHPDLLKFLNEIDNTKQYTYISNACDYEHFSKSKNRIGERPADFPQNDKPILGYYGAFSEWLDYDIIRKYADEGIYHVVMIGGIQGNVRYNMKFEHKNITWLDHKPYDELPYYLSWFDKCFLPFKDCELTKYVNPCKLWEYMASEKEIIKHNVNMGVNEIITYEEICKNINKIVSNKNCKNTAIVLDKYLKGGIERHTDLLEKELNADVLVFNQSSKSHKKINDSICSKYDVVLWQNVFNKLPPKTTNQKYIYIVHSQCDWWNDSQRMIVKENNHLIDTYIYVSDSVKENFEKNVLKPDNGYVIENQLPEIKNDRQEIQNLFVSSGSFNKMKGHYELIKEFSKLDNSNTLEIYGDIHNIDYFNMLQKHITDNKLDNIKLFDYTDDYINRLKEAEYFCLFSESEGCSYSMLEAISLNKKIICTKECLNDNMLNYPNKLVYNKKNNYFHNCFKIEKVNYLPYIFNNYYTIFNNVISFKNKNKIGNIDVNNINDVLFDLKYNNKCRVSNGISILLRIKNEESTIKNAILSIVDLVDEIIVVNNMSTDRTKDIIMDLESKYENIYCYNYNLIIPKVGIEHIKYINNNSENTLGTYYNWCLSKATKRYCIKWDGDFIGIRNNFKRIIDIYDLKNNTEQLSIWFTGASLYYNKYVNLNSWYDEFRVITKTKNAKWENWMGCETITNYVWASEKMYIFPSKENIKVTLKEFYEQDYLMKLKKNSPILFFENKDMNDFKDNASILDKRDTIDNYFITKYKEEEGINKINNIEVNILVIIPSLSAGGGNYWALMLVQHFKYFGWNTTICIVHDNKIYNFYDFDDINVITYSNKLNFEKYSHVVTTVVLDFDITQIKNKLYGFSHSDVSWVNEYYKNNLNNVICLNETTKNKFIKVGFKNNLYLLNNGMNIINDKVNKVTFDRKSIKILFCNRISFDKNTIMSLFAIKKISEKFNINLTLLAGGSEYSPIEFKFLKKTINYLGINDIVNLLETQKDVSSFYNSHDFCFLLSVSEGCSYGILESINHEIPFIYTDIDPNNEVVKKMLPCVNYVNNQKLLDEKFCITNYNDFIMNLGHIYVDELINLGISRELIDYILLKESITDNISLFYEPNQMRYLIENIKCEPNKYDWNINHFDINNLENLINEKKNIFDKNVNLIEASILDMINNYEKYKNNVIKLKKKISKIYFSDINIRTQILDIFSPFKGVSYED